MIQLQLDLSHDCTAVKACRDSAICNDLIAAGKDPGPHKNMGITDVSACITDSISYIQKEKFKDLDPILAFKKKTITTAIRLN